MRGRRAVAATLALALLSMNAPATPPEHRRPAEQTFLTYPEWFLVFSHAEYADFVAERDPSDFPFLGHVRQFWQGYRAIWKVTRRDYPFNLGYHVMIMVIGGSTTVEYALRAVYERLIGRPAELTRRGGFTDEERLGAAVAREYVDFIRVRPWYEFDFTARLNRLWKECALWGKDPVRKLERRYWLTSEYLAKAVYGWVIGKLTKMGYEEPLPVTAVLLDRLPDSARASLPELKVLDGNLVTVPRYEAFMTHAIALAHEGASFREIAGNRGDILVTALVPAGTTPDAGGARLLFRQPISTKPALERVALVVPVPRLAPLLVALDRAPASVEHVYDY